MSGLLWAAAGLTVYAQAPADIPRDDTAQQTIERAQDGELQVLRDRADRREEEESLDTDEAADTLESEGGVLARLPSDANLARLEAQMNAEPNNLDHYFAYAQMAAQLGYYDRAAVAYETMLGMVPGLSRVRLELGVMYLRLGRLEDAQRELNTVLEQQPPGQVEQNIAAILQKIDTELQEHGFSGTVVVGINVDSNANSAPDSDAIILFDTVQPLPAASRQQPDMQFFTAATLNHHYKPRWARGEHISGSWKTTGTVYHAEQSSLETLDIKLLSLQTGPVFKSNESGITVSPKLGYNHIVLATHTYLRNMSGEIGFEVPVSEQVTLTGGSKVEFRDFENAPGVTTYDDRTGSATQFFAGARYMVTDHDYLSFQATARRERTRQDYYDNGQLGLTTNYTRVFTGDLYASANLGYKETRYDQPDLLFSARTRHDKERSAGLTVTKKLNDTLTASVGYQYRKVDSNLLNYDYTNHRITASGSAKF